MGRSDHALRRHIVKDVTDTGRPIVCVVCQYLDTFKRKNAQRGTCTGIGIGATVGATGARVGGARGAGASAIFMYWP